jgi:hypothetical protein
MSDRRTYYFSIDDFARAHGEDPDLRFEGRSPQALADVLGEALRTPQLFERWRLKQDDPDEVDMTLAVVDAQAEVQAEQSDLHVDLTVITDLPMRVLRQRMELLIGPSWKLRDVR